MMTISNLRSPTVCAFHHWRRCPDPDPRRQCCLPLSGDDDGDGDDGGVDVGDDSGVGGDGCDGDGDRDGLDPNPCC